MTAQGSCVVGAIRKTAIEVLLLAVLATVIGFTANAVRASGSIKWSKNYFDKGTPRGVPKSAEPRPSPSQATEGDTNQSASPKAPSDGNGTPTGPGLEHGYQVVRFQEVVEILNDPATEDGLNVFVDARHTETFEEGHIPGAHQCFPFEIEKCIDELMEHAEPADKVIVYCNGGDCEDSVFMCRELLAAGLAYDQVFLYEGGWKEWEKNGQPIETGP